MSLAKHPEFPASRPDRSGMIDQFLAGVGWGDATRGHLAGDASFRRYERVVRAGQPAVLMDAPPPWEDVRPFVAVTSLLRDAGLSAPAIHAADEVQGFLLLEDLGDDSFTRHLRQETRDEGVLYSAAVEALAGLQRSAPAGIAPYDEAVYLREVALFSDWFLPQAVGIDRARELREVFLALWRDILMQAGLAQSVLVHRDYHADNLLWLPQREGMRRVGMLDYQDALLGDPFYDLVSLLEDARRDVLPGVADACFTQFLALSGERDVEAAQRRYAVLGAQRNMKIVGIFTRLCVRDGKPQYLSYLPRVWGHIMRDMRHPLLAPLGQFIAQHVPQDKQGVFVADMHAGSLA